jgi:hypothetical protein
MSSKYMTPLVIWAMFVLRAPADGAAPSDPCSLLTKSQVSAVLGVQVESRLVAPTLCEWAIPGEPPSIRQKKVTVSILTPGGERRFAAAKMPIGAAGGRGITKTPASGIGDDAVFGIYPPVSGLTVKKGDFFFAINVYGFPLDKPEAIDQVQAKEKTLALQVLSKL